MSMVRGRRDIQDEVREAIAGSVEFVCLDMVVYELQRLMRAGRSKPSRLASLALDAIPKTARIVQAPVGPREVDLSVLIFGLATKERVAIATVDQKLLELCSKNRVPWVRPRAKKGVIASWRNT